MGTATPGSTGNPLPIRSQHACSRSRWGAIEESDSIPCEGGASGTGRAAASTDCTSASTARIAASSCGRVASCQPCSTKPEAARRGFSQVCVTLSLPKALPPRLDRATRRYAHARSGRLLQTLKSIDQVHKDVHGGDLKPVEPLRGICSSMSAGEAAPVRPPCPSDPSLRSSSLP